jgi:hypothetical protein
MLLRSGATELLPADLCFNESTETFHFNWRNYLSMLYRELEAAASISVQLTQRSKQCKFSDTVNNREESGSLVKFATSLFLDSKPKIRQNAGSRKDGPLDPDSPVATFSDDLISGGGFEGVEVAYDEDEDQIDDHTMLPVRKLAQLILAAGTYNIGVDGRCREVRRARRRKLWTRTQQSDAKPLIDNTIDVGMQDSRLQQLTFERRGEGKVAMMMLMLQVQIVLERSQTICPGRRQIQW